MMSIASCQKILVVDDHETVLGGTTSALSQAYPEAKIRTATTAQAVRDQLSAEFPDVLVTDLSIPDQSGSTSQVDTGIQLLCILTETYPELNIVVQSAHVKSLVRLKPIIDNHQAGFTIVDKRIPIKEMLTRVDWALNGLIYTPRSIRTNLEVKPEWIEVLQLAFKEGLQDRVIADRMHVAERTVRNYWSRVQNALGVYPENGKNIRIQTEIRAREKGLID